MLTKEEFLILRDVMRFKSRPLEGADEKRISSVPFIERSLIHLADAIYKFNPDIFNELSRMEAELKYRDNKEKYNRHTIVDEFISRGMSEEKAKETYYEMYDRVNFNEREVRQCVLEEYDLDMKFLIDL